MSVVDTNVLVHASAPASPLNDLALTAIVGLAMSGRVFVTRQIIREYLPVMTRPQPWGQPVPLDRACLAASGFLRRFGVLEDSIVATMLAYGVTRLLTFNTKHFRRFEPLIEIVEP